MSRNAFVPMTWITSDLNGEALRTLILISFYADAKTGECWPSNATLQNALGKTERTLQKDLRKLVDAGLISIRDGNSKNRIFRIESPEWFDRPSRKFDREDQPNPVKNGRGSTPSKSDGDSDTKPRQKVTPNPVKECRGNPVKNGRGPNKNTPIEHTHEHSSSKSESFSGQSETVPFAAAGTKNIEPFEAGIATRLPDVRNAVEPFRRRAVELTPTEFPQPLADRITEVLGINGDKFARKVTQDQADSGFCEWVLKKSETAKNPIGFALHLLQTEWREGWTNPNAAEDARYAELVEMMRRIQQ